jgi:hypothetical protein
LKESSYLRLSPVLLSTSGPVSKPLAGDAAQCDLRARRIINTERDTVAVTKIKFGKIAM